MSYTVKVNTRSVQKKFDQSLVALMKKLTKQELIEVGNEVLELVRQDTLKGVSPIKGNGRFPKYKDTSKYPGGKNSPTRREFPDKRARPVNLWLSGEFLSSLQAFTKTDWRNSTVGKLSYKLFIGFKDRLSRKKEQGHREGVNGQPMRPIIPEKSESFSRKYLLRLKDSLASRLNKKLAK